MEKTLLITVALTSLALSVAAGARSSASATLKQGPAVECRTHVDEFSLEGKFYTVPRFGLVLIIR